MLSSVIKDTGDIFTRLFDHRPFTNGEINYFVREFEESRKNREQVRIEEIKNCISSTLECKVDEPHVVLNNFTKLNTLLDIATQNCHTIIENQQLFNSEIALKDNRERRIKEWETFNRQIETNMTHIDSTFVEKEKELIEMYKDLDRKLHLTN